MPALLERKRVLSTPTPQAPTLRAVLEELGITPFTPESVGQYKRKKMAAVMEEIQNRDGLMQEVIPAYWERQVAKTRRGAPPPGRRHLPREVL